MKTLRIISAFVFLGFLLVSCFIFFGSFQLKNPGYLFWVHFGGECPKDYFENFIFKDPARNRIIQGLSESRIRGRFPSITDGSSFPENTYRSDVLKNFRKTEGRGIKIFWFDNDANKMGWAIILHDGIGVRIEPIKG